MRAMNEKRLNKLNELTKNSYYIYLDEASEFGISVINRQTGRPRKIYFNSSKNKNYYAVSMTCKNEMKEYQYRIEELKLWLQGCDLLNKRVTDFDSKNKLIGKYYSRPEKMYKCKICGLKYPEDEMRVDSCYLCREEITKNKNFKESLKDNVLAFEKPKRQSNKLMWVTNIFDTAQKSS